MDNDTQADILQNQATVALANDNVQLSEDTTDVNSNPPLEVTDPVVPPAVIVPAPVQNPIVVQTSFGRGSALDPMVQTNISHP